MSNFAFDDSNDGFGDDFGDDFDSDSYGKGDLGAFDESPGDDFDEPAPPVRRGSGGLAGGNAVKSEDSVKKLKPGKLALILGSAGLLIFIIFLAGWSYLEKRSVATNSEPVATSSSVPMTQAEQQAQGTAQTQQVQTQPPAISKVAEPKVEETYTAQGVVTNKYNVLINGQISYVLDITITREGNSRVFQYYTAKDVYDGMNIGAQLNVVYTGDSEGNFIPISITR